MKKPKKMTRIYKGVNIIWSALCGGTWITMVDRHPRFYTIKEAKEYIDLRQTK